MTLLFSINALAGIDLKNDEFDKASSRAKFSADLWTVLYVEDLNNVLNARGIKNNLGCEALIEEAKQEIGEKEALEILDGHLKKISLIIDFKARVEKAESIDELVPSVQALRKNNIDFNLVKRFSAGVDDMQLFFVEMAYKKTATEAEKRIQKLSEEI